jgi:hypothetical protein
MIHKIKTTIEMHLANKIALLDVLKEFSNGDSEKLKQLYTEFMEFLHND